MTRLNVVGTGLALAITLVVAFVLCAIAQAVFLGPQFSHMWLALFTGASAGSVAAWVEGIIASAVVGFISGAVFAFSYNKVAA